MPLVIDNVPILASGTAGGHATAAFVGADEQWRVYGNVLVRVSRGEAYFVAEDPWLWAYGMGDTPQEAVQDWYGALMLTHRALEDQKDSLAPDLARQLQGMALMLAELGSTISGRDVYGSVAA